MMDGTQTSNATAKMEHARLDIHEPGAKPGILGASLGTIRFQFNPKELTVQKSAKWESQNQKKSASAPPSHYTGLEPQKLSVEMFFDVSREPGQTVVKDVEKLFETLVPTSSSLGKEHPSPPWVRFAWGALSGFVGYVKSVSAKYTLFASDGRPLRAVCTVALEELPSEQGKQNPTSGGLLPRRVHTMREGDTLALLAYREYGSASLWRPLAEVNGIDDPLRIRAGSVVFLPAASELRRSETRELARREVSRART